MNAFRTIPLTRGKIALVDADRYAEVSQWKWYARKDRSGHFYATRRCGEKLISMHNVIFPPEPGKFVDRGKRIFLGKFATLEEGSVAYEDARAKNPWRVLPSSRAKIGDAMIVTCEKCGERLDDEFHSTICPHRGIGYCRACDRVVCVCSKDTKNRKSNQYREQP